MGNVTILVPQITFALAPLMPLVAGCPGNAASGMIAVHSVRLTLPVDIRLHVYTSFTQAQPAGYSLEFMGQILPDLVVGRTIVVVDTAGSSVDSSQLVLMPATPAVSAAIANVAPAVFAPAVRVCARFLSTAAKMTILMGAASGAAGGIPFYSQPSTAILPQPMYDGTYYANPYGPDALFLGDPILQFMDLSASPSVAPVIPLYEPAQDPTMSYCPSVAEWASMSNIVATGFNGSTPQAPLNVSVPTYVVTQANLEWLLNYVQPGGAVAIYAFRLVMEEDVQLLAPYSIFFHVDHIIAQASPRRLIAPGSDVIFTVRNGTRSLGSILVDLSGMHVTAPSFFDPPTWKQSPATGIHALHGHKTFQVPLSVDAVQHVYADPACGDRTIATSAASVTTALGSPAYRARLKRGSTSKTSVNAVANFHEACSMQRETPYGTPWPLPVQLGTGPNCQAESNCVFCSNKVGLKVGPAAVTLQEVDLLAIEYVPAPLGHLIDGGHLDVTIHTPNGVAMESGITIIEAGNADPATYGYELPEAPFGAGRRDNVFIMDQAEESETMAALAAVGVILDVTAALQSAASTVLLPTLQSLFDDASASSAGPVCDFRFNYVVSGAPQTTANGYPDACGGTCDNVFYGTPSEFVTSTGSVTSTCSHAETNYLNAELGIAIADSDLASLMGQIANNLGNALDDNFPPRQTAYSGLVLQNAIGADTKFTDIFDQILNPTSRGMPSLGARVAGVMSNPNDPMWKMVLKGNQDYATSMNLLVLWAARILIEDAQTNHMPALDASGQLPQKVGSPGSASIKYVSGSSTTFVFDPFQSLLDCGTVLAYSSAPRDLYASIDILNSLQDWILQAPAGLGVSQATQLSQLLQSSMGLANAQLNAREPVVPSFSLYNYVSWISSTSSNGLSSYLQSVESNVNGASGVAAQIATLQNQASKVGNLVQQQKSLVAQKRTLVSTFLAPQRQSAVAAMQAANLTYVQHAALVSTARATFLDGLNAYVAAVKQQKKQQETMLWVNLAIMTVSMVTMVGFSAFAAAGAGAAVASDLATASTEAASVGSLAEDVVAVDPLATSVGSAVPKAAAVAPPVEPSVAWESPPAAGGAVSDLTGRLQAELGANVPEGLRQVSQSAGSDPALVQANQHAGHSAMETVGNVLFQASFIGGQLVTQAMQLGSMLGGSPSPSTTTTRSRSSSTAYTASSIEVTQAAIEAYKSQIQANLAWAVSNNIGGAARYEAVALAAVDYLWALNKAQVAAQKAAIAELKVVADIANAEAQISALQNVQDSVKRQEFSLTNGEVTWHALMLGMQTVLQGAHNFCGAYNYARHDSTCLGFDPMALLRNVVQTRSLKGTIAAVADWAMIVSNFDSSVPTNYEQFTTAVVIHNGTEPSYAEVGIGSDHVMFLNGGGGGKLISQLQDPGTGHAFHFQIAPPLGSTAANAVYANDPFAHMNKVRIMNMRATILGGSCAGGSVNVALGVQVQTRGVEQASGVETVLTYFMSYRLIEMLAQSGTSMYDPSQPYYARYSPYTDYWVQVIDSTCDLGAIQAIVIEFDILGVARIAGG